MTRRNPMVSEFLENATQWRREMAALRRIALDTGLSEELKWRLPCYAHDGHNVVIIQRFKAYCALMFFKGALLKDPARMLSRIGEHMQAPRQFRFTDVRQIEKAAPTIRAYIREAIAVEKAGRKVPMKQTADVTVPEELTARLNADRGLKAAFAALTPGRQRGYIYHIAGAKLAATRKSRVEKCVPRILRGEGLNDGPPPRRK